MNTAHTATHPTTDLEARAASDLAELDKYTDEDWERIHTRLDAEYRAKYKKEVADYRERFGEEPSLGTLIAAEARAECNNLTNEERASLRARGMALYNSFAKSHARHTTCR